MSKDKAQLATMPANRAQIDSYLYLCASLSNLIEAQKSMQKRVRLIPNGWRNFRLICSLFERLLKDLGETFEPAKRAQLQRMVGRIRIKLVIGPQIVQEEEQYVLAQKDFGVLISAATKQCQICMGSPEDCKQCELGRVIDGVSFISRQNRAWWEVLSRAERVDVGVDPGYMEDAKDA